MNFESFKNACSRYYYFIGDILAAIYRDILAIYLVIKVETKIALITRNEQVLADLFRKLVKKHPNKPCIIFNNQTWTFQEIEDYSNKIAHLFQLKYKLKKGDCVALFLENKPEYVAIWIGLSKIGVISSLINTNLKNQSLLHSIQVSKPKCIIYSSALEDGIETIKNELNESISLIVDGPTFNITKSACLEQLLNKTSAEIVQPDEKIKPNDPIMYVFTSGTTGLPKPAVIKQSRYCAGGLTFFDICFLKPNDVVYVTLPIYHANGAVIGIGASIVSGATVVLRNKFSATNFWKDCIEYNCTVFIYVGEICRFLVNQPASSLDRQHKIRKALGNGLRENVWKEFYNRFNIKCVEFYAASEGNCTMVNVNSKIGSCGFVPLINKFINILSIHLIKIDDNMIPIRDKNGFCIECKRGEKGLLIGMIGSSAKTSYNGYANNSNESNKKVIENIFKKGQRAFNSGDSIICDSLGYMYFCDRLGDTYRWRGENVATIEVENAISSYLNQIEAVVFGVEIPGQEGRAGMAAILSTNVDLKGLAFHLKSNLPPFARPLFVRLIQDVDRTGTFKTIKRKLIEESYKIDVLKDDIYYLDTKEQTYKELKFKDYENILNGNFRL